MKNKKYNHIDLFTDLSIIFFKYYNSSTNVVQNLQLIGNHELALKPFFKDVHYRDDFTFLGNGIEPLKNSNANERYTLIAQPTHPLYHF